MVDGGKNEHIQAELESSPIIPASAMIPTSLAAHLHAHHSQTTRLVSPHLHRLPTHLTLEFAPYTSGNRNAEILAELKTVWRNDALMGRTGSRIILFAHTRSRAGEMGAYLSQHDVQSVVVTGQGGRSHGSNRHLAGFLRPFPGVLRGRS